MRTLRILGLACVLSFVVWAMGGTLSCGRSGGSEASPSAGSAIPAGSPSPSLSPTPLPSPSPYATATHALHHVLGTGQSLASGVGGSPSLSTSQPYENRMFVTGVLAGDTGLTAFVPLVERSVETMSSGFANAVTKLTPTHDMLLSVHAVGGAPYRMMKKGTAAYATSIAQVTAGASVARALGLAYDVTAVTSADGGGDHVDKNTHLADDLAEWQRDYEADIKAITGQTSDVPLFNTQYSSWTEYEATSPIPLAQLRAHVEHPGKVVVVGPRYPFLYGPDGVHLTNEGYRRMGEYYARAYRRVVVEHRTWEPLRPKAVTRAGAIVTVRFWVPTPPIVFDTTRASDPGNMGFEYSDDASSPAARPTIASVAITGADTVAITLSAEPTAPNRRLRYAFTGVVGAHAGLETGARGNLRDSEATPLSNWCVHFDEAVP